MEDRMRRVSREGDRIRSRWNDETREEETDGKELKIKVPVVEDVKYGYKGKIHIVISV